MAEMFLGPIIEKLAIEPLIGEARSLAEIHREAESLKRELEVIEPLLRDAEQKSRRREYQVSGDEALRAWTNQIRRAASRSEIAVDEYRWIITNRRSGFAGFINSWKSRRRVASKLREANRCLAEIRERGQGYGLKPLEERGSNGGEGCHVVDPRLSSLFLEDDEIVGIESEKSDLVQKLVGSSPELAAVWIVGEGGIGKTTLAKRVFDDETVTRHFESVRAWITVSQPYDLKKVVKAMKEKICSGVREVDTVEDLIGCLRDYLRTKRYVIVFDDVWEERFWGDIKLALPNNNHQSRVLITTRNEKVSDSCNETPHHVERLKPWSLPLAWELFCKKAFRYKFQENCPDEVKELSKKIVIKCQGLPLVIAAIAGMLAAKETSMSEWENVLGNLSCAAGNNDNNNNNASELTRVHEILSLGYYDLPHSLRPCLMYFCMFPEDYSVSDDRLYRLWIAEGFVKAKGNRAAEDVAKEYMSELVRRNLVLFIPWRIVGVGNHFRVHDLMRDVILAKAEELGFCQSWNTETSKFVGYGRRLTISGEAINPIGKVESSEIRSLILSDQLTESSLHEYIKKFKFLEVMDAQLSLIRCLPKELGKMSHLKYLSLQNSNVKSLPKSIGKLYNLYSLDVRDTLIVALPKEINKLKNLRHILANNRYVDPKSDFKSTVGVRFPEGFGELEELQTLTWVDSHLGGSSVFKELSNLRKLRWLNIDRLRMEFGYDLCTAIEKMDHLQRLFIRSIGKNNVLNLQHISSPPLNLQDLILVGPLDKLPTWILKLRNLRGLCLSLSGLVNYDAIESLRDFPNLETLQIGHNACQGHELLFEVGGLLKLKRLSLVGLDNLKEVRIERGALPVLERLVISECSMLDGLSSLQHLEHIKEVTANGKRIF